MNINKRTGKPVLNVLNLELFRGTRHLLPNIFLVGKKTTRRKLISSDMLFIDC